MKINGQHFHTIWLNPTNSNEVIIINQNELPFKFQLKTLKTFDDAFVAIKDMEVRGAPLIGVTAAFGMYLGLLPLEQSSFQSEMTALAAKMKTARPTAVNLAFAVDLVMKSLENVSSYDEAVRVALSTAEQLKLAEITNCDKIGDYGLYLIEKIAANKPGECINILTHCNAGWLACIDWGTATAPIYKAHQKGIPVHVWVDETRPRNQGSKLTAFELQQEGVPHTVIADNTGGHLMQHGMVDLVLVGSDRTTKNGDVCNKIGTYLKALAASDNDIPFYVALPFSSIDLDIADGIKEIPIEERNADEVKFVEGKTGKVQIVPDGSRVANYGFDVTPARLVTALITEKGVTNASVDGINALLDG